MKKILFSTACIGCLLTSSVNVFAIPSAVHTVTQEPKLTLDQKVAKMDDIVTLTAEQKAQYKDYLIRKDKDKEALKAQTANMTEEDRKKAQKEYKEKYQNELKKILTPEQLKKLEEAKEAKEENKKK